MDKLRWCSGVNIVVAVLKKSKYERPSTSYRDEFQVDQDFFVKASVC